MFIKKKINTQGIIALIVAIVAALLLLTFVWANPIDANITATDEVKLEENGEASYLNLSVPNANQKEDSLSLIDKLEQIKNDSINNSRLRTTGLAEYDEYGKKKKSDFYIENDRPQTRNNYSQRSYQSSSSFNKNKSSNVRKVSSFDDPLESKVNTKTAIVQNDNSDSGFFKKNTKKKKETNQIVINIYASIHTNQTIMNNQRVKFRTTKEFIYNGKKFPINTIIYGLAEIKPNRLIIKINKINQTDIKLEVYDSEDSEQGLYVLTPNLNASLKKELQKEGIEDDDLSNIPFSRSLKNIFEKKVKEEKVQLLNNYKVLIKISNDE